MTPSPMVALSRHTGLSFPLEHDGQVRVTFGGPCTFDARQSRNGLHRHNYHEVCLVLSGHGEYRHGQSLLRLSAGDMFLADPGVLHEIRLGSGTDEAMHLVYFLVQTAHPNPIAPPATEPDGKHAAHARPGRRAAAPSPESPTACILRRFYEAHAIHVPGGFDLVRLTWFLADPALSADRRKTAYLKVRSRETLLLALLDRLSAGIGDDGVAGCATGGVAGGMASGGTGVVPPISGDVTTPHPDLESVLHWIHANPASDAPLEEIAVAVRLSVRTIQRLFRQHADTTCQAYRESLRMRQAAALLRMNFRVAETARRVGIPDAARFSRRFRVHFGCSPKQYQQDHPLRRMTTAETEAEMETKTKMEAETATEASGAPETGAQNGDAWR